MQGRFPIRVELNALKVEDFERILTEPNASLTEQYTALMQTEGFGLSFDPTGVRRIAEISQQVNETAENIGARRLHTDKGGESTVIDASYVDQQLGELAEDEDLSRCIL